MRTLLLDGDIFAFQFAIISEQAVDWGDGLWTLHAYKDEARGKMLQYIDDITTQLGGDEIIIPLSDKESGNINFRNTVYPDYKSHRVGSRLPMLLWYLRDVLRTEFQTEVRPHLEGDDVLGILATHPYYKAKDAVIVSIDKDMRTIPCQLANMPHIAAAVKEGVVTDYKSGVKTITEAEADFFHMQQALAGDPVDGYPGCPGIGMKRAGERLERMEVMTAEWYTPNKGKNKGQEILRHVPVIEEGATVWDVVRSNYEACGLTEEDALVQAQCARILRYEDWDVTNQRVKLWTP